MSTPKGSNETTADGTPSGGGQSLRGEALPVRSRYYERHGEQGLGLPTYGGLGVAYEPDAARGSTGWYDPSLGPGSARPPTQRGHAGRGPKGYVRSDERLYELVCERLRDHEAIDASDIEVSVHEGEVKLEGTVDVLATKQAAEDVAASVAGVRDVDNRLRRRPGRAG